VQASQPPGDRLTFGTNVLLELAGDVRFRVDFVVGYRGGVVVAEVDGQRAHRGLWASDRSRDYLLEDHGISRVHRVLASALNDPAERDAEVHRMLRRMTRLW
jgi:very-short-patch-repair endonuclease